jgi:uncharacterized protein (DUF1778 family)
MTVSRHARKAASVKPAPRLEAAPRKAKATRHSKPQKAGSASKTKAMAEAKAVAADGATLRPRKAPSETNLSMRVSSAALDLISSAAAAEGKTRTEFVLESARRRATEVLLDQRLFMMDAEQYGEFMRVLDDPPRPNAWLKRLVASPSPWEK